jgi:hypothetical protein
MSREVTVHLPERVWSAVVNFELYPTGLGLADAVRQRLREAIETRNEQPMPAVFRVVRLTGEDADVLENWLAAVCSRPDAPRDCRTALELLREGKRLSS